jgi:hypothetical protein
LTPNSFLRSVIKSTLQRTLEATGAAPRAQLELVARIGAEAQI